ncbi:glucosaminidase domain-containing protein [Lactococcus raffinolactis]|uniref:glucosaminidase domain-containing protein n=1 Tax=Pseudolactococcus raffinolactis TaxID=1366 RepID=UPI00289FC9E9|nr:glucosaminidase domain-containing protein [Lactococcus raffinolactis]
MKKFNLVIISVIILSSSPIALADEANRSENSVNIIDSSTENQVSSDDNTSSDDTKEIGSAPQTSSSVSKTTEPIVNESEQSDSTTAGPALESSLTVRALPRQVIATVAMYRLYNPNNKEHFYTSSFNEAKTLLQIGWGEFEGVGWYAPNSGQPVYRLYNPVLKDHHYTMSANERDELVSKYGWQSEGISWYSDNDKKVPIYRAFNPGLQSGSHNYTKDNNEQNVLTTQRGWINEGIAWYGSATPPQTDQTKELQYISDGFKGINDVKLDKMGASRDWVYNLIKAALPLASQGKIYPSVMVSQAILESGWGTSGLAVNANNLFGMKKSTDWTGAIYKVKTAEVAGKDMTVVDWTGKTISVKKGQTYYIIAEFKKYPTLSGSLSDYVTLMNTSNFRNVLRDRARNYKEAANNLITAQYKYATDPDYAKKVISIIEMYGLNNLD